MVVAGRIVSSGEGLGIRALLYCVFDKVEGHTVRCSDPAQAMKDSMKYLGSYFLADELPHGCVVAVALDENVVLGVPVNIADTHYDRNKFTFNICIVISSQVDATPHHDLAQHLASAFHALEVETKLLSGDGDVVARVQPLLAQIRAQLNSSEECFVRVGPAAPTHCVAFRVRRNLTLPAAPELGNVPLPLVDLNQLLPQVPSSRLHASSDALRCDREGSEQPFPITLDQDDLRLGDELDCRNRLQVSPDATLQVVVQEIDGVRTVREVIEACRLDEASVLLCLRHLLHFRFIAMIDQIRLESRYNLTPDFHTAFFRQATCEEAVAYVTAGRADSWERPDLLEAVQGLYAQVDGWTHTLGEFQQTHARDLEAHKISLRHFITFGLLQGFLEPTGSYSQALSQGDIQELRDLRVDIAAHKKKMEEEEKMSREEINKSPEVIEKVYRMKQLRAKELQVDV